MAKRSSSPVRSASRRFGWESERERRFQDGRQYVTVRRQAGGWESAPPMAPALQEVRECVIAAADAVLSTRVAGKLHDFVLDIALSKPVAVEVPDFAALAALVGAAVHVSRFGGAAVSIGNPDASEVYLAVSTSNRELWHDPPVDQLLAKCISRIQALGELEMPPRPKPPEFVELEELIRLTQSIDGVTATDRERLVSVINDSLESLNASLRIVKTGEIANRLNYQKNSKVGTIVLAIPQAGMRGFRSSEIEVVHTPPNRHPRK